ncbi:DNA-binding CsgD family transcriptional regulator [Nocardioides soli]|uniref:DNA-binding CsgD family transcriptional regulator n=2 Tax=Nocardioides soli TaxID=1036020 RepID=A0A7W4Z3V8_9ACTN|nr:DNA-binding CsgD family transcriptional regulator [Nocardioides soli]
MTSALQSCPAVRRTGSTGRLLSTLLGRANSHLAISAVTGRGVPVLVARRSTRRRGHRCRHRVPSRRGVVLACAVAVACKAASLQEFLAVVRKTMHGLPSVDRAERLKLVGLYRRGHGDRAAVSARLASLSRQERAVLGHLMAGHVVSEIAVLRVVSELTVRTQVKAVLYKLDVASQIKASPLPGTTTSRRAQRLPIARLCLVPSKPLCLQRDRALRISPKCPSTRRSDETHEAWRTRIAIRPTGRGDETTLPPYRAMPPRVRNCPPDSAPRQ